MFYVKNDEAYSPSNQEDHELTEYLDRFAALVASHALVEPCCGNYDQCQKVCMPRAASAEREACAEVCEEQMQGKSIWIEGARACSLAIRARGQA
jgi:hypothetical protein